MKIWYSKIQLTLSSKTPPYCTYDWQKINAWRARGALARVSVKFRKFSPCIARTRRACAGLTVYPSSRTLEHLAFDEYCRFDTSAFFLNIKRASLYMPKESRSIKTAIFIESLQFQRPRGRVNCQTRARAPRARHAGRKFTKIYGNPRTRASRAPCTDFFVTKNTVPVRHGNTNTQ